MVCSAIIQGQDELAPALNISYHSSWIKTSHFRTMSQFQTQQNRSWCRVCSADIKIDNYLVNMFLFQYPCRIRIRFSLLQSNIFQFPCITKTQTKKPIRIVCNPKAGFHVDFVTDTQRHFCVCSLLSSNAECLIAFIVFICDEKYIWIE